jgi:oxygen-independent coproporphyrinogen-3 oxidase
MLGHGLEEMIQAIFAKLNMQCSIHMESHPDHLSQENLEALQSLGVRYLSVGVEALQDRHLKLLERPYTSEEVKERVARAAAKNFECLNIDFIFDLPGQTLSEVELAVSEMVKLGIHQAATYPLFRFRYTRFGKQMTDKRTAMSALFRRRRFLRVIEEVFYSSGFERSSVWAFTKKGVDKYCSVTIPSYVGIGASGGSYLKNIFYLNTFDVKSYIRSMENNVSPIALSIDLSEKAQMAAWLYWRLYETRFRKSGFEQRFGRGIDQEYGSYFKLLEKLRFLQNGQDLIRLTDAGAYWVHAFEDFFSIDYINKLWGSSKTNPWPEKVIL